MPYIQNTSEDQAAMLQAIGVKTIEDLFTPIPAEMRLSEFTGVPKSRSEADVLRDLNELAAKNTPLYSTFLGAGIEKHFIPHVVDHISLDGNFITAYTPYQPEVSQGTLTAIFQFQTMFSMMTGLPVSNASLYDGASAVAEAAMVSFQYCAKKFRKEKRNKVVMPAALHPEYQQTLKTYCDAAGLEIIETGFDPETGRWADCPSVEKALEQDGIVCMFMPYPNFFGVVEDLSPIVEKVHATGALAVAVAHPLALSVLKTPAEHGCDIAVGEGQPIGCYQAFGGPAFGYFSCSQDLIRFAPGRIVSETVDKEGTRAFCLALATREQHIRREKATSNICTNQALMALRATIYLGCLGKEGYVELGETIMSGANYAKEALQAAGVKLRFADQPCFNELVIEADASHVARCREAGIEPGLDLGRFYEGLKGCYLVTVGELNSKDEIDSFVNLVKG